MTYPDHLPVGRRVKVDSSFSYDGILIEKGETGLVTADGGNSLTVQLDKAHPGLDDNELFFAPPEWGDQSRGLETLKRDRFYSLRKNVRDCAHAWLFAVLASGASFGVVAHATFDHAALPAHIVRDVETDTGGRWRVTFERVGPSNVAYDKVTWRVIERHPLGTTETAESLH